MDKEISNIGWNQLTPIFPVVVKSKWKTTKKNLIKETAASRKIRNPTKRRAFRATNLEMIDALKRASRNILFQLKCLMRNKSNRDDLKTKNLMVRLPLSQKSNSIVG